MANKFERSKDRANTGVGESTIAQVLQAFTNRVKLYAVLPLSLSAAFACDASDCCWFQAPALPDLKLGGRPEVEPAKLNACKSNSRHLEQKFHGQEIRSRAVIAIRGPISIIHIFVRPVENLLLDRKLDSHIEPIQPFCFKTETVPNEHLLVSSPIS